MFAIPNPLGDVRLDALYVYYTLQYVKKNKPRGLYLAFDETDDFAHAGEYAAYPQCRYVMPDWHFIGELWQYLQSDAKYKGKTTFIITCDSWPRPHHQLEAPRREDSRGLTRYGWR